MANRVIKDSIWNSPTLAKLDEYYQDQWPRWLLMADDWGCFNADPDVVTGLAYPKRRETADDIERIRREYYEAGLLFIWSDGEREWGYFVSWDSHHNYCNKTGVDGDGNREKHRRRTPEPPEDELGDYLERYGVSRNGGERYGTSGNGAEQSGTSRDNGEQDGTKGLNPNPNPNPKPKENNIPAPLVLTEEEKQTLDILSDIPGFDECKPANLAGNLKTYIGEFPDTDPVEVAKSLAAYYSGKRGVVKNPSLTLRNWFKNDADKYHKCLRKPQPKPTEDNGNGYRGKAERTIGNLA